MKTIHFFMVMLMVLVLGSTSIFAQESFFYSRDKKIAISPSPTKVITIKKADYPKATLNSWLSTSELMSRFELSIKDYDARTSIMSRKKGDAAALIKTLQENENFYLVSPVYVTAQGAELAPTDEITVQFKQDVSEEKIKSLIQKHNLETIPSKKKIPNYYVFRVPARSNPITIANRLQESGLANWSQPNFIAELIKHQVLPNDTYFPLQFQLHNTGQVINGRAGTAGADVDAPQAWTIANGAGVIVAVIDEGADLPHPDLPAARVVNGYDFGDDDNNPAPAGDSAHGTACSGIVAATQNNNLGISGIAPNSSIMPIKIWKDNGGSATVNDVADAIDFAWQNGAHILSNSWGYGTSDHDLFPAISDAIGRAKSQGRNGLGSIVVFAAGNTADHKNGSNGYVTFPGNRDEVITVGASDRNDLQSNYSPTDDEIKIVAPSHSAYRCQIATEDLEVYTIDIRGNAGYNTWHMDDPCLPPVGTDLPAGDRDYTGLMGGTSAACPLVAGIAALLIQVNPNLSALEVEDILRATAVKIDPVNGGYDSQTGHSKRYGYGRANAHRAVVPTVVISAPSKVRKGDSFTVKVTGSAPFGIKSIWWFGQGTGIPGIDQAHWQNATGSPKVYSYTWTATIDKEGTYRLGANARDILYPNPGDGYPHQASEGSGIATTEIKVTPLTNTVGLLAIGLTILVSGVNRARKRKGTLSG